MSMNQAKKRKQKQVKTWSWPKESKYNYFMISVVLMACFFGYQLLTNILNQPLTSISIEGSFQQVKSNQIEGAISEYLDKGFLAININDMQKDIIKMDWIDKVSIRKRWPGKLEINVFEHTPVARWGERGLLNDKGVLFIDTQCNSENFLSFLFKTSQVFLISLSNVQPVETIISLNFESASSSIILCDAQSKLDTLIISISRLSRNFSFDRLKIVVIG